MNTIKVYLSASGSIASLEKDFPLFQHQYQNKLLNVYVPTSLTSPNFVELTNGKITQEYVAGTALKTRLSYTNTNGKSYESKSYYLRYLKTLTQNGVEYALFERKLPKEYTLYNGAGVNAPVMTFNVVNVNTISVDGVVKDTILNITSSQTCAIDVMPSTSQDADETIEASEAEVLEASINSIEETLLKKQDKEDKDIRNTITEGDISVVGGINDAIKTAKNNAGRLDTAEGALSDFDTRIGELEGLVYTGEYVVGQLKVSQLPQPPYASLDAFVMQQVGREKKNGDVIMVILEREEQEDTIYKFYVSNYDWQYYEIQYLEKATNKEYGIIRGNYNPQDKTEGKVSFDIVNGEIVNVYFNPSKSSLQTALVGDVLDYVANISEGDVAVPKAIKDDEGNVITNTYMTKQLGATKSMLQEYALPRIFNDILYFNDETHTLVNSKDTLPSGAIGSLVEMNTIGEHAIGSYSYTIPKIEGSDINFQLSAKNSAKTNLVVVWGNLYSENIKIRTEVYFQKLISEDVYDAEKLLGVGIISVTPQPSVFQNYGVEVVFDELDNESEDIGNKYVELKSLDKIVVKCYFDTESSEQETAVVLMCKDNSSAMNLNVGSVVKTLLKGDIDEIDEISQSQSVEYDDQDGIKMTSTGKITYDNGDEKDASFKTRVPLIAQDGIVIETDELSTKASIKVDEEVIASKTYVEDYVSEHGGKLEKITLGTEVYEADSNKNITLPTTTPQTMEIEEVEGIDIDEEINDSKTGIPSSQAVLAFVEKKIEQQDNYPNAVVVGEPLILNGNVSNFSEQNYMIFPFVVDIQRNPFSLHTEITTGIVNETQQNFIDSEYGIALAVSSNGWACAIGNAQGTSWQGIMNGGSVASNTTYSVDLSVDIDYNWKLLINGTQVATYTATEAPYPTQIYIGGFNTSVSHIFNGSINMNKSYVKVRDLEIWKGMTGSATNANVSLSNLDAIGRAKFDERMTRTETQTYVAEQIANAITNVLNTSV